MTTHQPEGPAVTTNTDLPPVGTIVTIDDPRCVGTYRVTGHGPKNATCMPCFPNGTVRAGRGARMPGWMLHPYTAPDGVTAPTPAPVTTSTPIWDPGMLVLSKSKPGQVFVVLADKGAKVNIVELGGDRGRYWRVTPSALTVLPLSELKDHL